MEDKKDKKPDHIEQINQDGKILPTWMPDNIVSAEEMPVSEPKVPEDDSDGIPKEPEGPNFLPDDANPAEADPFYRD